MWKRIKAWFIQDKPTNLVLLEKPYRKPSDTTKLTQGMYDFVVEAKKENHGSNDDLCAYCNLVFGTNFSRSKLTRIWTGKINREDLPNGITYNIPF